MPARYTLRAAMRLVARILQSLYPAERSQVRGARRAILAASQGLYRNLKGSGPGWLVVLMFLPRPASAAEVLWTEVIVRVYDGTGVTPDARRRALKIAGSIIAGASVEVVWRTCTGASTRHASPDSRPDPCSSPLAAGELALRITSSRDVSDNDRTTVPLGEALIDTKAGAGVFATVYADRVNWMAAQTGVDAHELLGRAIAHELGHLLMATSAHGAKGLMRPVWLPSEVRRQQTGDWSFEPQEIAAIKARTRARKTTSLAEIAVLR